MSHRYQQIKLLGKGGMGEVWLVYDKQADDYYAMKLLYEDCDEEKCQLLAMEAEIMMRLHHSGIP